VRYSFLFYGIMEWCVAGTPHYHATSPYGCSGDISFNSMAWHNGVWLVHHIITRLHYMYVG